MRDFNQGQENFNKENKKIEQLTLVHYKKYQCPDQKLSPPPDRNRSDFSIICTSQHRGFTEKGFYLSYNKIIKFLAEIKSI